MAEYEFVAFFLPLVGIVSHLKAARCEFNRVGKRGHWQVRSFR